jgi:hypothetical protein
MKFFTTILRFFGWREPRGPGSDEKRHILAKLENAQPGDILLFRRARGVNRLITWLTKSRYYHVGIYAGDHHVVESRPRGVICRDLLGPDGDRSFDVIPAPDGQGYEALNWARTQIGAGYDKSDAVVITLDWLFGLRWPFLSPHNPNEYSCGEFVTLAFRHAGVQLFPDRTPQEIVPAFFEPLLPRNEVGACGGTP